MVVRQAAQNHVDEYRTLTLAVDRRLRYSADDTKSGLLTSSIKLEFTSLARRLDVRDFSLMEVSIDNSGQSELLKEYVRLQPSIGCRDSASQSPASLILHRAVQNIREHVAARFDLHIRHLEAGLRTTTAGPGKGIQISAYIFEGQSPHLVQVETKHPRLATDLYSLYAMEP